MERVISKEEIDAMLRAASKRQAHSQNHDQKKEARSITPCTFQHSGQLTAEQVVAINGLHEGFARGLSQSLGGYLRVSCEVNLVSTEQLAYSQLLERIPEVTYVMGFSVQQMSAPAALQIDHSVVFPLVDILLGGIGNCEILTREVSEIEEHIMGGVAEIICQQLETAWTALDTKVTVDGRQSSVQLRRFMSPREKTLCLSFQVTLGEATGKLNLILPISISNTLLRKLAADSSHEDPRAGSFTREQMTAQMLDCSFPVDLEITAIKLPFDTVAALTPQSVCDLGIPVRKPGSLVIAGREAFDAIPVRHGRNRAAQLGHSLTFSQEERK
jgi:flagellar motor switch protein FliM